MYKVFIGFRKVGEFTTPSQVKAALSGLAGSVVNVLKEGKAVYSAYHFEAREYPHGWE